MNSFAALRKPIYSGLVFFSTILVLSVGYATYSSLASVDTGTPLTKEIWNQMIGNLDDHEGRISGISANVSGISATVSSLSGTVSGISSAVDSLTASVSTLQTNAGNLWGPVTGGIGYSAGNVGIGTNTPFTNLHIARDVSDTDVTNGFGNMVLGGLTTPTKHLILGYNTTSNYGFLQGNTYGVSWDNIILGPKGGNVGIGVTSPSQKLDVAGITKTTNLMVTGKASCSGKLYTDASGNVLCGTDATGGALTQSSCQWVTITTCWHSCWAGTYYQAICPAGKYMAGYGLNTYQEYTAYNFKIYCCTP